MRNLLIFFISLCVPSEVLLGYRDTVIRSTFQEQVESLVSLQKKIQENSASEKHLRGVIYKLNQEIFHLSEQANTLSLQAKVLQDETKLVADRIVILSDEYYKARMQLREGSSYLRFLSRQPEQKIFWQSEKPSTRSRHFFLVRKLSEHQVERVRQLRSDQHELELRRGQFVNQKYLLSQAEVELIKKKNEIQEKQKLQILRQAAIRSESQKLIQEISRIRNELSEQKALWEDLSKLNAEMQSLERLIPERFFERKARLRWPVKGQIEQSFGPYRVAPNVHLMQKGIWIRPTAQLAEVRAIYKGRVTLTRNLPGFGLILIIDHEDDYYSVYGGLERVQVQTGALVNEGELVGLTSEQMYFEIRQFTEPHNPKDWLILSMN
jgi:septal ring factor EnvC (AmiA/AmiB activator)